MVFYSVYAPTTNNNIARVRRYMLSNLIFLINTIPL